MILPIVKQSNLSGKPVSFPCVTVQRTSGDAQKGAEAFCLLCEAAQMTDDQAVVSFAYDETLCDQPEIYRVTVKQESLTIGFRDVRGAINGAATAALLLRKEQLTEGEILDWPDCTFRSFLIDMARGLPEQEKLKETICYMALGKYNRLHLHLTDSKGPCYQSEVLPEYHAEDDWKLCTRNDLRELVELCSKFAIEVIPEIELITHTKTFCKVYPQFVCDAEDADDWEVCPGNEDVWGIFEKLLGEIVEMFPESEYIHLGADELEFADLQGPGRRICHWDVCKRCEELRRREGLNGRQEQIYYVINRLHEMVKAHGKKMIMWNDQIDISGDVPLSREILMQFWRIAAPGRGPYEGCSMAKFLEKGFQVINSYYPYTYMEMDQHLHEEKLKSWSPLTQPEFSQEYAAGVVGGEMCAWEFGNKTDYPYINYVTPPALGIFADCLWNFGSRAYDVAFKTALAEFVFGHACENDVFACTGTMIPPRSKERYTNAEAEALSPEMLDACIAELTSKKHGWTAPTSEEFVKLLGMIRASLEENKNA